jgi:DNA-binding MarR family transcriptional regulator
MTECNTEKMRNDRFPDAERTLGALLRRPYERMSAWLYAELARRGHPDVRVAHSAVLRNIAASGSRVTELAARAGMAKQSMAYLVDQLESFGYLEIGPDPHDRRARLVRLTPRGEALVREAVRLSGRYERRLAELVGAERIAQLRETLETIYDRLDSAD